VLAVYPAAQYGGSYLWAGLTALTDGVRGCPTRRFANAIASHTPVYRFLYTHVFETGPAYLADLRASHLFEDRLLWHYDLYGDGNVLSPGEEALSARMTDYWTNFARTGNPNGPGLTAWPLYNARTELLLTLDNVSSVVRKYHDDQCAVLDTIVLPE
jgi:para-nitrobenzyl esterase